MVLKPLKNVLYLLRGRFLLRKEDMLQINFLKGDQYVAINKLLQSKYTDYK